MKRNPTALLPLLALAALTGCANTSQTLGHRTAQLNSATTFTILTTNLTQTSPTPINAVMLDSGGVTGTDVASSVFAGFSNANDLKTSENDVPFNGYSHALKIAQDADFDSASVTITDADDDGNPESYVLSITGYKGSGSASIAASAPIVEVWADFARALSADERDRFFRAMETVDAAFAAAVRAAVTGGVPTPLPMPIP